MIRILFSAWIILTCAAVSAQPRIRTEKGPGEKTTDFILENKHRGGTLTVLVNFKELYNCSNLSAGVHKYTVHYDNQRFLSLRAADEGYGVGYNYSWRWYLGPLDPDVDTAFVYRMPCSTLRPQRVIRTVYVLDKYRKAEAERESLGFMFPLSKGDTVYAMRRGVVVEIRKPEKRFDAPRVSFTTNSPNLLVEQPDGTLAWYICVDGDNVLVDVGDEVLPGTPLALAGSYDGEYYKTAVQIYWYETDPDRDWNDGYAVSKRLFPRFQTTDGVLIPKHGGVYTPVFTPEMQTRELTARELKKWRATHPGHKK